MTNGRTKHLHQKKKQKMEAAERAIVHPTTVKTIMATAVVPHTTVVTVRSVHASTVAQPIVLMDLKANAVSVQQALAVPSHRRKAASVVVTSNVLLIIMVATAIVVAISLVRAATNNVVVISKVATNLVKVATTAMASRKVAISSNVVAISLVRAVTSSVVAISKAVAVRVAISLVKEVRATIIAVVTSKVAVEAISRAAVVAISLVSAQPTTTPMLSIA